MDRKSIIILVLSFMLLMLWPALYSKWYPPRRVPAPASQLATSTNLLEASTNAPLTNVAVVPPVAPVAPAAPAPRRLAIPPGTPEQVLTFSNATARYEFTSYGGGLKSIELLEYPQTVACRRNAPGQTPAMLNAATNALLTPVLALRAASELEGDNIYRLSRAGDVVRAEKTLTNGVTVVKEFRPSSNYLVYATVKLENRSAQPVPLPGENWSVGTATPVGPKDTDQMLGVYWYNGSKEQTVDQGWFANRILGCIPGGTPRTQYEGGLNNVVWAAVHNQFFTIALIPKGPAPRIVATQVPLPAPPPEPGGKARPALTGYEANLLYPASILAPNQVIERQFTVFAGPKEYHLLARLGGQLNNNLDLIMGYSGFFGFFAKMLLLSMNGLHAIGLSYALAIIAITVIIKLLFWPLTQASTRSMKRMQTLQPQMKAIQEKFKEDPAKMNRKMMEFMKEHKVSPMGGCLPMVVQIPVFFGFYKMIQSAIELRGARFLWACDLSSPDTLFMIPGLNFPFNPLPLVMGATMLWQARLTPPSPGMDPMQQKLMKYMPLMFLFILYNFSAGLTLYWTVQNLLTIAQMKLTKPAKEDGAAPARHIPHPKKR